MRLSFSTKTKPEYWGDGEDEGWWYGKLTYSFSIMFKKTRRFSYHKMRYDGLPIVTLELWLFSLRFGQDHLWLPVGE